MLADADIKAVYRECCERLRNGECMARPIPRALDVRIGLERRRIVASKHDVFESCERLRLVLSDSDAFVE